MTPRIARFHRILARKLSHTYSDTIVQPSLLDPPRIKASRVETHQAAGPGQKPQIQSEVASSLRESGRVEIQPVLPGQLTKIDVDGRAEAVPRPKFRVLLTLEAPEGVADILEVESHATLLQAGSLAAPVSQ